MSQLKIPFAATWYDDNRQRWVCNLYLSPNQNATRAFSKAAAATAIDNALEILMRRTEYWYHPLRTSHPLWNTILNHLGPRWKYAAADRPNFCIWTLETYRTGGAVQ